MVKEAWHWNYHTWFTDWSLFVTIDIFQSQLATHEANKAVVRGRLDPKDNTNLLTDSKSFMYLRLGQELNVDFFVFWSFVVLVLDVAGVAKIQEKRRCWCLKHPNNHHSCYCQEIHGECGLYPISGRLCWYIFDLLVKSANLFLHTCVSPNTTHRWRS